MTEQITGTINLLCEKLGVAAEHLYPLLIKQAYIEGATNIFFVIVEAIFVFMCVRTVKRMKEKLRLNDALMVDEFVSLGFIMFGGLFAAILVIVSIMLIKNAISAFWNPEWYAITKLLSEINGVTK